MGSVEDPAPAADVEQGTTEPVGGVAPTDPVLTVTETRTEDFSLVGVTWAADAAVTDTVVQVRVQDEAGAWGDWTQLTVEDAGADADDDTADARGGTDTAVDRPEHRRRGGTGDALRRRTDRRAAGPGEPGESPADTALDSPDITDTADAATTMPAVYSRAQWGADESHPHLGRRSTRAPSRPRPSTTPPTATTTPPPRCRR